MSPASIGSATLSASEQDHPAVSGGTYDMEDDKVLDVKEDLVIEGSNGVVLSVFVQAQAEIEDVFPVVGASCVSGCLLNPPKGEDPFFSKDLSAMLNSNFDSVEVEVESGHGTHEDKAAQRAHNEQLFRTQTTKALVASVKHTAEGDANMRLIEKTLDGVLLHNNFMSLTARNQVQSNVTFATLLHDQENSIKALADSVARLGGDYQSLNDKVDQGHNLLDGKITDVHNQVDNLNNNIISMKNETATGAAAKLQMDKMMAYMMRDTTSAATAPAVPVSTPAPVQFVPISIRWRLPFRRQFHRRHFRRLFQSYRWFPCPLRLQSLKILLNP
jgi:hypothetical protein